MSSEELAPSPSSIAAPKARADGNRRLLSAADRAWLRVDREHNHMIITAVLVLAERPSFAQVQERLAQRLQSYPRLRQRIVDASFGTTRWEDDPEFEISRQTEVAKLAEPADRLTLEAFVSDLMQRSLDPARPLWRIYFVEKYFVKCDAKDADPNGRTSPEASTARGASESVGNHTSGSALVVRAHHCLADGIALLRVLLSLADEPPDITFPTAAAGWARPDQRRSATATLVGWGRTTGRAALGLLSFLTSDKDPYTRFRDPLGPEKRAAWSNPIPLDNVKQIGRALDATVNDVLLTAAAGALGRTLAGTPEYHPELVLRGVVPVNLRAREDLLGLGNYFGLVFLPMPVGLTDPRNRLERVRQAMRSIKASPEALAWFAILRTLGRVPSWIEAKGVEIFSRKASLVITSLAGPRNSLHFCGAEIRELMFWVPSAGDIGLGMSLLTYHDRVQLGVATDLGQDPDPGRIVKAFEAEISNMLTAIASDPAAS